MAVSAPALDRALFQAQRTPLGSVADDLLGRLQEDQYAASTICRYLRVVAHFGQWLGQQHLSVSDVSDELISDFVQDHLPQCQCAPRIDRDAKSARAALHCLAKVLRRCGRLPAVAAVDPRPAAIQQALNQLDEHLDQVRGLGAQTRRKHRRYVGMFLLWRFGSGAVVPTQVQAEDVRGFLLEQSHGCMASTLAVMAGSVRTYISFLLFRGERVERLLAAVPAVAQYRHATVPQYLTENQEQAFLRAVDRSQPAGRRDYAMFLLMCRLGLRVGDLAALTLDDLDWRLGTVRVRSGKTRRASVLPLPSVIGDAIVAYLQNGRPNSGDRRVFLRHRPPRGHGLTPGLIRQTACRAYRRAGLPATWAGTHRLRHTAATRMLRRRATLKQIADVLGHRCMDTTAIYAKVDLQTLRAVALPWPGGTP